MVTQAFPPPEDRPDRSRLLLGGTLIAVLVIGLLAVLPLWTGERAYLVRKADARVHMLTEAQSLLTEIRASDPDGLLDDYHDESRTVHAIEGNADGAGVLHVSVDDEIPTLPQVTVTGQWTVDGEQERLSITTAIYNPSD